MNNVVWDMPILDGFSFSQANSTSEITLAEMEDSSGTSRRGRKAFNDALDPGEWSFSTYVRPFQSSGSGTGKADDTSDTVHAVEEVLWALFNGADQYDESDFDYSRGAPASGTMVSTHDTDKAVFDFSQSNKTTLGTCNIYFVMGDANRTVIQCKDAIVNEATINFDVDGIAQIDWSGLCSEVNDFTGRTLEHPDNDVVTSLTVNQSDHASGDTTITVDSTGDAAVGDFLVVSGLASGTTISSISSNTITYTPAATGAVADDASITLTKATQDGTICVAGDALLDTNDSHRLSIFETVAATEVSTVAVYEDTDQTDNFIRNRLTQLVIAPNNQDPDGDGTNEFQSSYDLTLTGGSVTFSNNVTYITPEELGKVNIPFAHVTGTRSVSGSVTCYLGLNDTTFDSNKSRDLFDDMRNATSVVTQSFDIKVRIGGNTANTNRLHIDMPTCHIEIPTHSVEDVISLETNFQALPSTISGTDDATIEYHCGAAAS